MAIKKSELYSTLWKSCDELRGGMDASQYKDYVLVMLFVKYISDKAKSDADFIMEIPQGCSFDDFINLKGKDNIGEEINKKIASLAETNGLGGVINVADFCDELKLGKGKDLIETLSKLIGIFQSSGLDFGKNRASDDDLMGDAYEYLMKNFATESGKSKGQFYTPAEVSRIMAKVIGLDKATAISNTIYDPTCGSGSLLLRALAETPHGATIYGQEKDSATVGLAKMNMILHGETTADIKQGDTINNPLHKKPDSNVLATFDYIVANPPFSTKSWLKSAKENDVYGRWNEGTIGVPPEKNGDYAFLLHIIRSMNRNGQGACILPHGVLFRGNSEADIRKYILSQGYLKGIIGLPANLFFGAGIPACIIVLDKKEHANRKGLFMIDAKAGYAKDGPKNRLRERDIRRIVDVWLEQKDVPHYARFVQNEEIVKNDYNLNIPRYITLVEGYDVYEQLLTYWNETMQDDVYLISSDGWKAEPYTPQSAPKKNKDGSIKESKEKKAVTPDDIVCDLLPVTIVIDEYFGEMKSLIQTAEERLAEYENKLADLQEEHADNYLDPNNFADDKLNDVNVKKQLKALNKKTDAEEITILKQYISLKEEISETKRVLKVLKYELLVKLNAQYAQLYGHESEIKRLVIEKKWFATLTARLDSEMQHISQNLTTGVTALSERYAETLSQMEETITVLESKVKAHLGLMGFS